MFVALNGTVVQGRVPWPEFAELAAKTGYGGVDIVLDRAMVAGVVNTKDLLARLRLQPAVVNLPVEFRKDDAEFRASFAKLEDAGRFSAAIGCPRMTTWLLPSSELPKKEQRAIYVKRLGDCAKVLAHHNVRLGLEFVSPVHLRKRFPHEFIWRMDEMLALAKDCGPNVGLLLDCWHWHHAGATVDDIVRAGRDAIVHVHLNDSPDLPPEEIVDNQRLMPGEGVIDLDGFLRALKRIGYTDAMSVEVFGRGLKDMTPEAAAKLGADTAKAAMRRAGIP
jgi:sugar phosphate isomerase/epimerase